MSHRYADSRRNPGGLTDNEQEVYQLREAEGLSFAIIGDRLGVTKQTVHELYHRAKNRVNGALESGALKEDPLISSKGLALQQKRTGEAAVELRRAAKEAGLSPQLVNSILRRATQAVGDGEKELKPVNNDRIIALCEDRIHLAFSYMDDAVMATASAAALATTAAILIDKRQILKGEPTSIMGIADRRKLNDIADALVEEVARRKKIIDITPVEVVDEKT